jgi:hypothetical protein
MSVYNISNQSELVNFMSDTLYQNGNITNNILLSAGGLTLSSQTLKVITSSGNYKIEVNASVPIGAMLFSKNNITDDGFQVGYPITKDMRGRANYTNEFDPMDYYPQYFPDMAPFTDSNIVQGDKDESDRLNACQWRDWGNDVFDDWGFFYLYDVDTGKYYFPLFDPRNQGDGELFTQTFSAFGRVFTVTHGYPVQGIFKFDISVDDNRPFKFGAYGNMGSDGNHIITEYAYNYTKGSNNLTLYYVEQAEDGDNIEILYSYFIPKRVSENAAKTYGLYQDGSDDQNSLMSKSVMSGLIVYFSKAYDVKDWVVNDLDVVA